MTEWTEYLLNDRCLLSTGHPKLNKTRLYPQGSNTLIGNRERERNKPLRTDIINTVIETCWKQSTKEGSFLWLWLPVLEKALQRTQCLSLGTWAEAQVNKTEKREGRGQEGETEGKKHQRHGREVKGSPRGARSASGWSELYNLWKGDQTERQED